MSASLLLRRSRFGKPVGSLAAASDSSEARGGDGGVEGGGEPAGRADTSTSMLILPWVLRSFVSITSPDLTQLLTNPEANYCLKLVKGTNKHKDKRFRLRERGAKKDLK